MNTRTVAISQGAAGTTELAPAVGGHINRLIALAVSLDAAGTAKLSSGGADLSGAMNLGSGVPLNLRGEDEAPIAETAPNAALSLTTTGGAAKGLAVISTEPAE